MDEKKEKPSDKTQILIVITGLTMMAGAAATWHYLKVDSNIAILIAFGGGTLIYKGFGID